MACIFTVKVIPSSGRNAWSIDKAGTLKCHLKSPPERGLANKELITLVARACAVPQSEVSLVSGASSRTKNIKIDVPITYAQVLQMLGIEEQRTLDFSGKQRN